MIFTIPKTLQIGGLTITVEQKDIVLSDDEHVLGNADYKAQKINVSNISKKEYKEMVFFHELTHMVLHFMGENEITQNEKFVDGFSTLMYQAIKTMK